jgi:hypothetical protein
MDPSTVVQARESYSLNCRVWRCFMEIFVSSDRLCDLVVRVPGYWTEMYCVSCEVRNEFMYVMYNKVTLSMV